MTQDVLAGRRAVDAYRAAHAGLHQKPYYRGVHEDHTPLLKVELTKLQGLGFTSLDEFFDASDELNLIDTGVYKYAVHEFRKDLEMLGQPASNNGVEIRQVGVERELVIDGLVVMATYPRDHATMMASVDQCPSNARVFIGGLGFGLVVLYLAESHKAKSVVVYEVDQRVIDLIEPRMTRYLTENYPTFNCRVVGGDATKEVSHLDKFDWIFFDLLEELDSNTLENIGLALSPNGIFTDWWMVDRNFGKDWWQ